MLAAVIVLLSQTTRATPAPTPTPSPSTATTPTPVPVASPTPVGAADPYRPRALSDIARERRLGRLTGSGAVVVTTPEPESPSGTPVARRAGWLKVEDIQDNGSVTDGFVSVYGTVRNTGLERACRVKIFLRLYDDHGVLLSTGETAPDLKIVPPGVAVTFGGIVRAPQGLRGSRERKPDPLVDGPASTNWQRVGRVDAEIIDVSEECR